MVGLVMGLRWFLLAGVVCAGGCQVNDNVPSTSLSEGQLQSEISRDIEINAPVGVFSTYLSQPAQAKCDTLVAAQLKCIDDAIDVKYFFNALKGSGLLPHASPGSEEADYQILIANQAATIASPNWWDYTLHYLTDADTPLADEVQHFTEFTVQWRGVEIDSQLIQTYLAMNDDHNLESVADAVVAKWWSDAAQRGLFTAQYLFKAIKASDYLNDMRVPEVIASFTRFDTQLFHDPFQGAITRYTHNEFDDALLDITVFPLTTSLDASIESTLINILQKEESNARFVAQARNLMFEVDQPVTEFLANKRVTADTVYMLAVHAEGEESEPIYATTYVFRQQDKIIKLSTTFPPRIANPLIEQAIASIKVPAESPLMAALREIAKARSEVN
ncbi:hypothetical protein OPS25_02260 [Alteromonas ponticola]|uniref:Lipoprotein n=1 Tax=Alteromonas aquimaris TaxID=2998417 RepID=A0ABT3P3K1_9ALTE|nr:hypothetical protein [Alteromonas aquimaris]MCW8107328.1 hypothetical protein [Alteromonas aquimaris]